MSDFLKCAKIKRLDFFAAFCDIIREGRIRKTYSDYEAECIRTQEGTDILMKKGKRFACMAFFLAMAAAGGSGMSASASEDIRIIGESGAEEPEEAGQGSGTEEIKSEDDGAEAASLEEDRQGSETEDALAGDSAEANASAEEESTAEGGSAEESATEDGSAEESTEEGGSAEESAAEDSAGRAEAETAARDLYVRLRDSADRNSNEEFASLFAGDMDASRLQNQLQAIKSSLSLTQNCDRHSDYCFSYTEAGDAGSAEAFVGLTDYHVKDDGSVDWYSTLLHMEEGEDGWKVSQEPALDELAGLYPEAYQEAVREGRNAVDLYPYCAMRFDESAFFEGTFYSLVNMVWENADGSLSFGLWLSNGQGGKKWCDRIELNISDQTAGRLLASTVSLDTVLEPESSAFLVYTVPADSVPAHVGTWSGLSIQSNLIYE